MNKSKILFGTALMSIMALSLVCAFGVSSPYWEGNPLKMYPGESKIVNLNLQNIAAASESVTVKLEILQGSEIASLDKNEYIVEAGSNKDVPLNIKVPSDATIGTKYTVKISTTTLSEGTAGGVGMSTGMLTVFDVMVTEKTVAEPKSNVNIYLMIIAIAVVLIAIIYVLSRKR